MWSKNENEMLRTLRDKGYKIEYIAFKLNKSFHAVASKISRDLETKNYKSWTNEEFNKAKELYQKRYSYRQIGEILNRTRESVQGKFQEERKKLI